MAERSSIPAPVRMKISWGWKPRYQAASMAFSRTGSNGKSELTDSAINAAVVSDLHFEMPAFPSLLHVSTQKGIVILSGSVDNILAKRRSVKIAESVRGVFGVIDRIIVQSEHRPDEDIRKDILTALRNDPATEFYKVSVSVKDAVVTFNGTIGPMVETSCSGSLLAVVLSMPRLLCK